MNSGSSVRYDIVSGSQFWEQYTGYYGEDISPYPSLLKTGDKYLNKDLYLNGEKMTSGVAGKGHYYYAIVNGEMTLHLNGNNIKNDFSSQPKPEDIWRRMLFLPSFSGHYQVYSGINGDLHQFIESHGAGNRQVNLINEKVWKSGVLLNPKSGYLKSYHDTISTGQFEMSPKTGEIMNLYN